MKAAWDILGYEVGQLCALWKQFTQGTHNGHALEVRNALVESAIIHLRIILEMLRDTPGQSDDYCLTDLIDIKDKPAALPALMTLYRDQAVYAPELEKLLGGDPSKIAANLKLAPKTQIDKLMFHPTKSRTTSHDWTPILKIIFPPLAPIIRALEKVAVL